ncbi:MAG: Ech hydrogenase subunit EchB [Clostridium sp. SCN 57-10]|nr:MAG: Ech hydrogenase subunit EchB [Clostridium sp. SCN 57-10]
MSISVIYAALYVLLAPLAGGLLAGIDRKITARMQGRQGPPVLQPFYDLHKLRQKQALVVNTVQDFLVWGFLVFVVFTGALFFSGGDLLLVFFALTLASIFFIMSAYSANSPYSAMGAQRELVQIMAYEPMVLLVAIGFYDVTGSFSVRDIVHAGSVPAIVYTPGIFIGFLWILAIKFRKSPFDLSTSHHAHQEMVKGMTTELSGHILALVEIAHWYENIFLLGVVGLFFMTGAWWSGIVALVGCAITYFFEILADNVFPRVKWEWMLKATWIVIAVSGVVNLLMLTWIG